MKNKLLITTIALSFVLALPIIVFGAATDVEFSDITNVTVGGVTLTVSSNSYVESMMVDADKITVVMPAFSIITVNSADRRELRVSPSVYLVSSSCSSSSSSVSLESHSGDPTLTVTITPQSTNCVSGGGGGGGGGGAIAPFVPPQELVAAVVKATPAIPTISPATPSASAQPSITALAVSPAFNKTLKIGMTNPDVKRLQQFLNSDPDTIITSSGTGSPGNETEYFGTLTRNALRKFQAKHNIVSSGDEQTTGYGLLGPSTRAKIAELFTEVSAPSAPTKPTTPVLTPTPARISPTFTKGLSRGMTNSDIKRLQQLLNSDSDTIIASSGTGSPGNETEYFGTLTEKALQKFQEKYGVAKQGDSGYGYVGPKTRAKLNEVFGGTTVPTETPVVPIQVSTQELQPTEQVTAELEAMIKQLQNQVEKLQIELNAAR